MSQPAAPTVVITQAEYNEMHREIGLLHARVRELEAHQGSMKPVPA